MADRADPIYGAARRTYLRKNIELGRHGCTGECPGCDAARLNTASKPHTAACRARIEEAMTGDEIRRAPLNLVEEEASGENLMILKLKLLACGDASKRVLRLRVDTEQRMSNQSPY